MHGRQPPPGLRLTILAVGSFCGVFVGWNHISSKYYVVSDVFCLRVHRLRSLFVGNFLAVVFQAFPLGIPTFAPLQTQIVNTICKKTTILVQIQQTPANLAKCCQIFKIQLNVMYVKMFVDLTFKQSCKTNLGICKRRAGK